MIGRGWLEAMLNRKVLAAMDGVIKKLDHMDDSTISSMAGIKNPTVYAKMLGFSDGLERAIKEIETAIKPMKLWERDSIRPESDFVFPVPVKHDGKREYTYSTPSKEWFLRIQDEIIEAVVEAEWCKGAGDNRERLVEELQDIIHVCTSYQDALGYDFNKRQEMCKKVNEKNKARGYF